MDTSAAEQEWISVRLYDNISVRGSTTSTVHVFVGLFFIGHDFQMQLGDLGL